MPAKKLGTYLTITWLCNFYVKRLLKYFCLNLSPHCEFLHFTVFRVTNIKNHVLLIGAARYTIYSTVYMHSIALTRVCLQCALGSTGPILQNPQTIPLTYPSCFFSLSRWPDANYGWATTCKLHSFTKSCKTL